MPVIYLETFVAAPVTVVFDLSRSVDLHQVSTSQTQEVVVAGRLKGLLEIGESVTWRAKHFGIIQNLSSMITEFNAPYNFTDEMVHGAFKCFKHIHRFEVTGDGTTMIDVFSYQSPLGLLGKLADWLFLKKYMTQLLSVRNQVIKQYAENNIPI
jgi:ligand-binding SRPBCC domain-containing protein